jgi:hypothetical protein
MFHPDDGFPETETRVATTPSPVAPRIPALAMPWILTSVMVVLVVLLLKTIPFVA